jgi:TetR/AcrR family transcriptional regulator
MKRRSATAVDTRELIFDAAEHQFTRYGYSKVTMEEIADDAGLKKASLYYYFPTKEELFQAVIDRKHQEFRHSVERILIKSGTVRRRIQAYVEARYTYFDRLLHLNIVDFRRASRNMPAVKRVFQRHASQELEWLTGLFEEGKRNGEFNLRGVERVAKAFFHILQGLRIRFVKASEDARASSAASGQLRKELMLVTQIFLDGIHSSNTKRKLASRASN